MGDLKAIAAMAENRVIGDGPRIPWHLPEDFRWFKEATLGGVLVMGRRTFESIGRPLPGRETVVLSGSGWTDARVRVVPDLRSLRAWLASDPRPAWVCGGGEVYRQLLPECSELWLSHVEGNPPGDVRFPAFEDRFEPAGVLREGHGFRVVRYIRRSSGA